MPKRASTASLGSVAPTTSEDEVRSFLPQPSNAPHTASIWSCNLIRFYKPIFQIPPVPPVPKLGGFSGFGNSANSNNNSSPSSNPDSKLGGFTPWSTSSSSAGNTHYSKDSNIGFNTWLQPLQPCLRLRRALPKHSHLS